MIDHVHTQHQDGEQWTPRPRYSVSFHCISSYVIYLYILLMVLPPKMTIKLYNIKINKIHTVNISPKESKST